MPNKWHDPDDAPELTDDFFNNTTPMIGDRVVSKEVCTKAVEKIVRIGRPKLQSPKRALTVRYDADIIETFKASGDGWQTRMNDALRDWLKTHSPA